MATKEEKHYSVTFDDHHRDNLLCVVKIYINNKLALKSTTPISTFDAAINGKTDVREILKERYSMLKNVALQDILVVDSIVGRR